MHGEIPVLQLEYGKGSSIEITDIFNIKHTPKVILEKEDINEWLYFRRTPISKFTYLGGPKTKDAVTLQRSSYYNATYSLNMFDHYWIKETSDPINWSDVNPYNNVFSQRYNGFLLGNRKYKPTYKKAPSEKTEISISIDLDIPCCFSILGQTPTLLIGSYGTGREPLNYSIVSKIAKTIGISRIADKKVIKSFGKYYSQMEMFTNMDVEYIPLKQLVPKKAFYSYELMIYYLTLLGISEEEVISYFDDYLTVSFIATNTFRPIDAIGVLRDPITCKYIGMAPIFILEGTLFHRMTSTNFILDTNGIPIPLFNGNLLGNLTLVSDLNKYNFDFDFTELVKGRLKVVERDEKIIYFIHKYIDKCLNIIRRR